MGEYTIYEDYPQLDFTRSEHVKDDVAQHIFPVYRHTMFENDPEVSQPKHAYLYYYYNIEPKKKELACPEGCWIISKYLKVTGFILQEILHLLGNVDNCLEVCPYVECFVS